MSSPNYTPEQLARFQALADEFARENAAPPRPLTSNEKLDAALKELDDEVDGVLGGTISFGAAQLPKLRDAVRAVVDYLTETQGRGQ